MRVVFDTNVYVSAFAIPGGNAEEAYLLATEEAFELVTSIFILTETAGILRTKFDWSDDKVTQCLQSISRIATVVKTRPHLHVLQDEPDNRVLECAVAAQADYLVTGDRHLLALQRHKQTTLISLADFLALLGKT